jgi:hypothetical protein
MAMRAAFRQIKKRKARGLHRVFDKFMRWGISSNKPLGPKRKNYLLCFGLKRCIFLLCLLREQRHVTPYAFRACGFHGYKDLRTLNFAFHICVSSWAWRYCSLKLRIAGSTMVQWLSLPSFGVCCGVGGDPAGKGYGFRSHLAPKRFNGLY